MLISVGKPRTAKRFRVKGKPEVFLPLVAFQSVRGRGVKPRGHAAEAAIRQGEWRPVLQHAGGRKPTCVVVFMQKTFSVMWHAQRIYKHTFDISKSHITFAHVLIPQAKACTRNWKNNNIIKKNVRYRKHFARIICCAQCGGPQFGQKNHDNNKQKMQGMRFFNAAHNIIISNL